MTVGAVVRIARHIAPGISDGIRLQRSLAVLSAYFDDSCDGGVQVFAVAGYVGPAVVLDDFASDWAATLKEAPHPIHVFKAADCENGKGAFALWEKSERQALQKALIARITSSAYPGMFGVACGVVISDIATLSDAPVPRLDDRKFRIRGGYMACLLSVLFQITRRFEDQPPVIIDFTLDRQHGHEGFGRQIFDITKKGPNRFRTLVFATDDDVIVLQAADLLAYETHKHLLNRKTDPNRRTRTSLRVLAEGREHMSMFFDADVFRRVLEAVENGRRIDVLDYPDLYRWRPEDDDA